MRSVVAYCRSAWEPQGGSSAVPSQAGAIRRYAKRRGLTLDLIYTDAGVSGATLDRPALRRLIADCRAGKIGVVITKDTARLSRDSSQLFTLLRIFEQAGVRVEYSTQEGQGDKSLELLLSTLAALQDATLRSKQAQ
jgi:site-specific DNA recombinase